MRVDGKRVVERGTIVPPVDQIKQVSGCSYYCGYGGNNRNTQTGKKKSESHFGPQEVLDIFRYSSVDIKEAIEQ